MRIKVLSVLFLFNLSLIIIGSEIASADSSQPSLALPSRYRDFKVYATSQPDPQDMSHIVATVQFQNEGNRPLKIRARLNPQSRAGFRGGATEAVLQPHTTVRWQLDLRPIEGLAYEVISGDIAFSEVRDRASYIADREFYIALQGPDPVGISDRELDRAVYWEGNIGPDPTYTQRKGIRRITAQAEVVGTYAPRAANRDSKSLSAKSSNRRVKPALTLASSGRTKYHIIVEPMPRAEDGSELTLDAWDKIKSPRPGEPELAFAVRDLQRCLKLMSGATVPVTSNRSTTSPTIRLRLNDKRQWAHPDAYYLFTQKQNIIVESGHIDGLRQGIYGLLTDYLDCHWFLPGQIGEEIPRPSNRTVTLPLLNDEQEPTFFSVSGMSGGAHRDWDRRNRSYVNRGRMSFGHAWHSFFTSKEFPYERFPDMWARDRQGNIRKFDTGYSFTNFCPTSPEVIELVAKKVNERLSKPDTLVTSIDPNDYAPHCLCDRCLAVDKSYGVTNQDGTYVTDRLLHFSREIYNRLEPQNRDKFLGILVYAHQMELPRTARPHERHTGILCNMDWVYDHTRPFNDPTSPQNREFLRQLQGWSKILPRFGYYDYYGHYRLFGPWGIVHKMREDLPAFRDAGGSYLMIEAQPNFGMHGFNLYVASQLAWNVDADVDALAEEFFVKFYGPAAAPMHRYWLAIERRYALARPGPDAIDRVTANPELWTELDGYLKQAEASVLTADQRFKDRLTLHRDGFEWGRRQYEFIRVQAQPDATLDYNKIAPYLKDLTSWLEQMKTKYKPSEGYWPTLVAPYFYSGTEEKIRELEARARAQQEHLISKDARPE